MINNWERFLPKFIRKQFDKYENLKKISENIGWLFIDKIIRLSVSLIVGVLVVRYLGPDRYGIWSYAIAFSTLFSVFASLGLDDIVIRELVKHPDNQNEILSSALILKFLGSLFALILSSVIIYLIKPKDALTFWLVFITSAGFIFQSFMAIDFYNQANLKSKYTVISLNSSFLFFSLIKIGLILIQAPLIAFAITGLLEIILSIILLVIFFYRRNKNKFLFTPSFFCIKNLLKDCSPLILSNIAIIIYMKIDQIMIGEMINKNAVGIYSAGVVISEIWYFIPISIIASVFPAIIETKKKSIFFYNQRLQQLYSLIILIAVLIALPMTFLSDWVIILLYGKEFKLAGSVIPIHIWTGVFIGIGIVKGKWQTNENKLKYHLYGALIGASFNVILNFILIPKYGIRGAAFATLISQFVSAYLINILFKDLRSQSRLINNVILRWRIEK